MPMGARRFWNLPPLTSISIRPGRWCPVLELTAPSIQVGVDRCIELGYRDLTAVPLLLFAARHNKFDVTNELTAPASAIRIWWCTTAAI